MRLRSARRMADKRWRVPKAKPGELKAQWGKLPHDSPQLCYVWGEGVAKADSHLLHCTLTVDWPIRNWKEKGGPIEYEPSFVKELEARGYDLTTLKFSIQKKAQGVGK